MAFFPKLPGVPLFHRSSRPEVSRPVTKQLSMSLTNKGLLNPTGHNNCFLNSCVQVLWHVDVFRRNFRQFKGHTCVGKSCIFCALQELFTQFQHSSQSALPPDDLRQALAHCYQEQHRFQLGIMDDAAECFEKILEQIHFHLTGSDDLDSCSAPHCLSHQKCSLSVLEMTECQCGETSEPLAFVQFVHYISAPSLGAAAKKKKQTASYPLGDGELFGRLVRVVGGEGEWRECETCHKNSPVRKMLLNNPDLVCIGMIWDSDQPNVDDIMSVVETVGTIVRVSDIFHRVMSEASSTEYCLSGMVAYYGHHYCTFCYHTVLRQWGFFDDANFRTIGSNWGDVVELCRKAHYQPLLLVYADPFGDKITMTTAPIEVTRAVATETKTKSLTPVAEGGDETSVDARKPGDKPLTNSGSHSATSTGPDSKISPFSTVSGAARQPGSATAGSHSGTKPSQDPGYEIDPNTFSLRRRPGPTLYPQLSQLEREGGGGRGGGGVEGSKSPVPSALPMSSETQPKTNSSFPVIFQSSAPLPQPHPPQPAGSAPKPSFPIFFQSAPSAPAISAQSQTQHFGPFTTVPPSNRTTPPNSHLQHYQQPLPAQRGAYSPSNVYSGRYPPPTYSSQPRPQTNAWYPSSSAQSTPWRGGEGGGGGGFSAFFQPQPNLQQQPHNFLFQSSPQSMSPRSSPSLFEKKTPHQQALGFDRVSGPPSLPASPAKLSSHTQRASSSQPQVAGTTVSSTSSPLIARPRPSPPRSVPSPNHPEKTSHGEQPSPTPPPTTGRDSNNLIEFSISPALLSPTRTNQPSGTQGFTPHDSPASSSYLSSTTDSNTSQEVSPYRPTDGSSDLSSLEEDLIQWSMSPHFFQKYRGRQEIRQGSSDSLMNTMRSGTGLVTAGRENTTEIVTSGVAGGVSELRNGQLSGAAIRGASYNTSANGESLLVDVEKTSEEAQPASMRDDRLNKEEGREREQRSSEGGGRRRREIESAPDPGYADPDEIQTMLGEDLKPKEPLAPSSERGEVGGGRREEGEVLVGERPGLGEDPLYAVPEQVAAKLRAKKTAAQSPTSAHSGDIPPSVEPVLREALEAWQKAESKRDSDVTLAKLNYSRAATLLMKVLLDPSVDQTLRQNISHKRQEALAKCSEMEDLIHRKQRYGGEGRCRQCGQCRQLNSHLMCGPCHLKNKISQT